MRVKANASLQQAKWLLNNVTSIKPYAKGYIPMRLIAVLLIASALTGCAKTQYVSDSDLPAPAFLTTCGYASLASSVVQSCLISDIVDMSKVMLELEARRGSD